MGYAIIKQQNTNSAYYTEFVIDTDADLDNVPIDECSVGSSVLCLDTGDVYMLNSAKEWVEI